MKSIITPKVLFTKLIAGIKHAINNINEAIDVFIYSCLLAGVKYSFVQEQTKCNF